MSNKTFIVGSEGLGRGDEKLGALLMANFLRLLGESPEKPAKIGFWNTGVKLCCEGSPVLAHLTKLASQGVEIVACTTCLEYFNLVDSLKVGKPTTMVKSIESMLNSDTVTL
jgi:selenium metabolism protein YedF